MPFSKRKLESMNADFRTSSPETIINHAINLQLPIVATTNFGPHEAALLHHVYILAPKLPIIWIDHGYNTAATYQFAESFSQRFHLNLQVFTPRVTRARQETVFGGVPSIDDELKHSQFTKDVKLEPFERAFSEYKPSVWLTAIRQEQTEHRASLDIFSIDPRSQCLKVAPFFYWTELDMEDYLVTNDLPIVDDYYDPTKVLGHRECGLHLSAEEN